MVWMPVASLLSVCWPLPFDRGRADGGGWCPLRNHSGGEVGCLLPLSEPAVACGGSALLAEIVWVEKEAAWRAPALASHALQQWHFSQQAWVPSACPLDCSRTTLQPLRAVSVQPTPALSPGLTSKAGASAPRPLPAPVDAHLILRSAGWWHRLSVQVSLQTGCRALLCGSEAPPPSWLISPLVRGSPGRRNLCSFAAPSQGRGSHLESFLSLFVFFPFVLPGYVEILLAPSEV